MVDGKFIMENEDNAIGYFPGARDKLTQTVDFVIELIMHLSFKGMIKRFRDNIKLRVINC